MRYRKLSPTGDYTLGTGADFYVNNAQAVAQAVLTRLKLWTGEWFLNTTDGVPWNTDVLGKFTTKTYDSVIKFVILATPGVSDILTYASTYDGNTRTVAVSCTLNTVYGSAQASTVSTDAGQLDVNFVLDLSTL